MDLLEEYYGTQIFQLYSLFGVVPGKKHWPRVIFVTFSIVILLWFTFFQLAKLVTERFKLEWIVDIVPHVIPTLGTLVMMIYLIFTTEQQKIVLLTMANDLREERTEGENTIKEEYAEGSRLISKIFSMILMASVCGLPLVGFTPLILNAIIPLNESREMRLLYNGEMFIDQEKYFYHIFFLEYCAIPVVAVVVFINENMTVVIIQHIRGMLAVIGYRLQNLTKLGVNKPSNEDMYADLIESRVRKCVVDHKKVLQLAALVGDFYDVTLTVLVAASFCILTLSLVQVMDPQLFKMNMVILTINQILQLYVLSYVGQREIDSSEQISADAYNAEWDICSANVRKMLQMIILRSSKPCKLVATSMYVFSIESFMTVMQTVTSCFMVLRQTC